MAQKEEQPPFVAPAGAPQAPLVLALDVGTSSTRALLFDARGSVVPDIVSQHKYQLTTSNGGEVSVDADMLADLVAQTIDEVLQAAGPLAQQIKAVALDTFWHSLLGVDARNHPLTPVITWEDTRAFAATLDLRKRLDEQEVHRRTGAGFHASYWPAKLLWLSQSQPDTYKQVAQWISFGEYLHRKFLGRSICSLSMASATGMLNTRARRWDADLMQMLQVSPQQLPDPGDMRDSIQGLSSEYANRWSVLRDALWFPAIGDGASACVGSGCASSENWSLTVGTSSAIRVVVPVDDIEPPPGLWLYLIDGKRGVIGGALSEGGNLVAWIENTLKMSALKDLEAEARKLSPDAHGLTILPFISGERSLGWHADARMTISGISIHTSPADLLRAAMEALAYQLHAVYTQLHSTLKVRAPRLLSSGGALYSSDLLRSIIADTLDTPVHPSRDREASARGGALLALEAMGLIEDIAKVAPHLDGPINPNKEAGEIYRRAAKRQEGLYHLLLGER